MNESAVYPALNKAWKTTTRILFGEELGELKDYEGYLKEAAVGKEVQSSFSKNRLWITSPHYCHGAKFFDYSKEQEEIKAVLSKPLDVNSIKDIDSLFDAVKEKLVYSGNKVLGNSTGVEYSDNISDSSYVYGSSMILNSKYMVYSYMERKTQYSFGSTGSGESSHILRCFYNNTLKRCFECCTSVGSSDAYFCYNTLRSSDCMFTFNVRAKYCMIGNIQLDRDKYLELKAKLISEIADELKKKKKLGFSIVEVKE